MVDVIAQERRGRVNALQHEAHGHRLQRFLRRHGHAGHAAQVALARRIDEHARGNGLRAVFAFKGNVGDAPVRRLCGGKVRIGVQRHTGFAEHFLRHQLVRFAVEGNVPLGQFHLRRAQLFEALDQLPRDAADNAPSVVEIAADGIDVAARRRAAEEAVTLHQRRAHAGPRSGDCRPGKGRTAV